MRYFRGIFDRILLGQKTTKATTADYNLVLFPGKVLPDAFNVFHQLIERVRLGARTLPVTSIVKREDAPFVTQRTECFEVCSMISCALLVSSTNVSASRMWLVTTHSPTAVECDYKWSTIWATEAIPQPGIVDSDKLSHVESTNIIVGLLNSVARIQFRVAT